MLFLKSLIVIAFVLTVGFYFTMGCLLIADLLTNRKRGDK